MARSLRKLSAKDLFVKNSAQDLLDYQNERRATKRAIWHAQSAEKVAWGISKFAPRHNESDLRGPKWREGCASRFKMSTAPQRERSDRPKVPTGLRERSQTSHCTTMRATRCAQSDEKVALAHVTFSQKVAGTTRNEHWKCQKRRFTKVSATFLSRSTKYCARHEKWAQGIWGAAPATRNHHHFHKQSLTTGWEKRDFRPCQNVVHVHQILRLPHKMTYNFWPAPANALATCTKCHACYADEKVSDVLHLSCKTTF